LKHALIEEAKDSKNNQFAIKNDGGLCKLPPKYLDLA
jgi:hypothetical protein